MPLTFPKTAFTFNFSQIGPFLVYLILSFSPLIEGGTTYYPVAIIQILTLFLLISGIFSFYHESQYLSLKTPLFYTILIFLSYATTIAFLTTYKLPVFQQIQLYLFYFILFYFSILFYLSQNNLKKRLLNLLVVMGLFESIYGIGQFVFFHERAKGTFFNPDFIGEYLAIIFCIALGLFFEKINQKLFRWLACGTLSLLAVGIILSQSRGAALAWSVGVSVIFWKRFRYKIVYFWLVLFILFVAIPNPLQHRFLHDYREDPYSFSRFEMWKEAIHIIQDHPLGIGIEMYPLISPQYAFPIISDIQHYSKVAESPHNEYLRLFTELGIGGGLFFLGILFVFYFKWRDTTDLSFSTCGILGGTVVFFVHSLVDSNFHEPALVITVILLSTFLLDKKLFHLSPLVNSEKLKENSPITFYFLLSTCCVSLFILGLLAIKPAVGWFYYNKGYEQIRQNRNQEAVSSIQAALSFENRNARFHHTLANAYFNMFETTNNKDWIIKSLDELDSALELNPIEGNCYKLKGNLYKSLAIRAQNREQYEQLYNEAFTNFQSALKLFPYDASLYLEIGEIHSYFQRFGEAKTAYDQVIMIEPNYLSARERKIELLFKIGEKDEAKRDYQKLIAVYENIKNRVVLDSEKKFIYFNQKKLQEMLKG